MHVNTINNKRYIGITCQTPENRWRSDGSGYARSSHFWNAIQKYGWDNFKHIIVLQNETFEYACSVEKCLIKHYKTKDPKYGYNLTDGGEGMCGWSPSDEWRRKQSENKKGIPLTEEAKRKISIANTGHSCSEETRKKISEHHADFSGENHPMYGKHPSEETRQKMSDAQKKRFSIPENRDLYRKKHAEESKEKMRQAKIGKRHSEETKRKISDWQQSHPQEKAKLVRCKETGEIFNSINEAQRKLHIYHIGDNCRGKLKSAGGLHFEFVDKENAINGNC